MIEIPFNEIKKSNKSGNISKNLNLTCLKARAIKFTYSYPVPPN